MWLLAATLHVLLLLVSLPHADAACTGMCCAAGLYQTNGACQLCPIGSYCEAGSSVKSSCADGLTTSARASTAVTDCHCPAGEYSYILTCKQCPPNDYCPDGTRYPCPPFQLSAAGSKGVQDCSCQINTFSKDGECVPVTICEAGHYQTVPPTTTSDRECSPCPQNSYCPNGIELKSCVAGLESPAQSQTEEACVCPDGKWRDEAQETTSSSSAVCVSVSAPCAPGTYENPPPTKSRDRACSTCQAGYYCLGSTVVPIQCSALRTTSAEGSTTRDDCLCRSGFYDADPTADITCRAWRSSCPQNSYESTAPTSTNDRECVACSDGCERCNAEGCLECKTGHFLLHGLCTTSCPLSFYNASEANNTGLSEPCLPCPEGCRDCSAATCSTCKANFVTFVSSGSVINCVETCPAGYTVDTLTQVCRKNPTTNKPQASSQESGSVSVAYLAIVVVIAVLACIAAVFFWRKMKTAKDGAVPAELQDRPELGVHMNPSFVNSWTSEKAGGGGGNSNGSRPSGGLGEDADGDDDAWGRTGQSKPAPRGTSQHSGGRAPVYSDVDDGFANRREARGASQRPAAEAAAALQQQQLRASGTNSAVRESWRINPHSAQHHHKGGAAAASPTDPASAQLQLPSEGYGHLKGNYMDTTPHYYHHTRASDAPEGTLLIYQDLPSGALGQKGEEC